jgi:flagellar biosynthesis protein FlhG
MVMDQAEGLRTLVNTRKGTPAADPFVSAPDPFPNLSPGKCPRVISVTSGKGGVGKTNVVANLAFAFTELGQKVLVLDADLGLANIDVLLGLTPQYTLEHFFGGKKSLSDILIEGPGGMSIMPASSGVLDLVDLNENQKLFLLAEVERIAERIDVLLIDTGAGIASNVLYFNTAAQEAVVVATPEPTSMTDAYALIKVLSTRCHKKHFLLLINQAGDAREARDVFEKISRVADRFLESLSIDYLGFIPYDEKLPSAVKHQRPVLEIYPTASSSRRFMALAKTISERPLRPKDQGSIQFFWKQLLQADQAAYRNGGML